MYNYAVVSSSLIFDLLYHLINFGHEVVVLPGQALTITHTYIDEMAYHTYIHSHTYTYIHIHTYIHTHTYTYINTHTYGTPMDLLTIKYTYIHTYNV